MTKNSILATISLLLFSACDDKAIVSIYKKNITQTPITCIKLNLIPDDPMIRKTLEKRYPFTNDCDLMLDISYKSGIKCNSRFNVATKTTTNFPNSYLKMELRKGLSLQYSYYMDLTKKPNERDVNNGFDRLEKDLNIISKVR